MPVAETHRFLFGRTPWTLDRRLWVLYGNQTGDWFYHSLYHGCMDLRRTLGMWGFEHGVDLTVYMDRHGAIDFEGNADRQEALRLFEARSASGRKPPSGMQRRHASSATALQSTGGQTQEDAGQTQEQRKGTQAAEAAGGSAQAIDNTFTRLTNLLRNKDSRTLLIISDISKYLQSLEIDQQKAALSVRNCLQDWDRKIYQTNLVVFIETEQTGLRSFLSSDHYKNVQFDEIRNLQANEVKSALIRLARRNAVQFTGIDAISKTLARHGSLRLSIQKVMRVLNQGQGEHKEVTLEKVLQLPPLNEVAIAEIKKEINELTGLQDVKSALKEIEHKARSLRKKLEDGESELPEETMHMIFYGAPGTGKTMVARIVARFFHALGLIERAEVRDDVKAASVMSPYQNESRLNMQQLLESCRGATLFIDEAHQFGDKQSMGAKETIQALVLTSWNYRSEMVIILAGYEDRMHEFFAMDEGLERRFPVHLRIRFANYTASECMEIFENALRKQGYGMAEDVPKRLNSILKRRMARKSFGNAGGVVNLVSEIMQRHTAGANPESKVITVDDLPPLVHRDERILTEARRKLNLMKGLGPVKEKLEEILAAIEYDLEEEAGEEGSGEVHVHPGNMLFVGPPGTGKTTVARLMGDILYGMGCIEKPKFLEVSRGDLIGDVQGASIAKFKTIIEQARDGVLFIDEAYAIAMDPRDTYGNEVVTELVRQITNPENNSTVFILAGYEDKIAEFMQTNPGLHRRFPVKLCFPNFTPEDCVQLARDHLIDGRYQLEDGVLEHIQALAAEELLRMGEHFGNAGWLLGNQPQGGGIIDSALKRMKRRIQSSHIPKDSPNRRRLLIEDLPPLINVLPRRQEEQAETSTPQQQIYPWTPQPEAIHLLRPMAKGKKPGKKQIQTMIQECAFQVLTVEDRGTGSATGFFVTPDGLMATCAHVVYGTKSIQVLCGSDRNPLKAEIVLSNDDLDLALIAVEGTTPHPYLPLGVSLDISPLSEVIAYGNAHVQPGEAGRFLKVGIVRNETSSPLYIETDGDVEKGFSGGPVFDPAQGRVIAIISGGYGPSARLMVRVEQLRELLSRLGYIFDQL